MTERLADMIPKLINTAIIAAGFGTRLGEVPKGLIKSSGSCTILGRVLDDLGSLPNIGNIAIITNSRYFRFYKEWLGQKHDLKVQIKLIDNKISSPEQRRGALGDLAFTLDCAKWWEGSDVLVLPCDTLVKFHIGDFIRCAKGKPGMTVAVGKRKISDIAGRLGCVTLEGGTVVNFHEKPDHPASEFAIVPFYYFPENFLSEIKRYIIETGGSLDKLDAPSLIISRFMDRGIPVYAFVSENSTLDVGKPEDLDQAMLFV